MDRQALRLEVLKLSNRPGQTLDQILATAKAFESYVAGAGEAPKSEMAEAAESPLTESDEGTPVQAEKRGPGRPRKVLATSEA